MTRQIQSEPKNYLMVVLLALALFATPIILSIYLLLPLQQETEVSIGIVRNQPGQAMMPLSPLGKLNAETEIIIALEKLNGGIAKMALHDPLQANLMPTRSEEEIAQQLRDFDPEMKGILITAYAGRAYWEPTSPPWGLFLLPNDKKPERGIPFGIVSFPYGMEKTREFTETTLNRLNANLKNPDSIKIIQAALATNAITDDTAIKLLAGTQLLDVVFREEHQLFLSPESSKEWGNTKQKLLSP